VSIAVTLSLGKAIYTAVTALYLSLAGPTCDDGDDDDDDDAVLMIAATDTVEGLTS
jgi:hypothetical protein